MNNGLLFLGGLLVVVLAALFAVPNFIDWNGYRGVFEEEASKVLGRDVRVGGTVNLKLLPAPYVRFEKVRIANLTGQTGEPFVRVESFTMWLSGPALLRGVLEASEIELNKPVLTLAADSSGGGNWTNIELKPGDLPFVPRDVALRSVKLIDGAVSIYNAVAERVALLEGIYGELSADGLKGPFRFKGSATWSNAAHDIKFATDRPVSDGSFGLRLLARADKSPNTYLLDGRVYDFSRRPTFKGTWSGKLAVPGVETHAGQGDGEPPVFDLKAEVTADALGAKFDDITLSLDTTAEAQTITGSATATWLEAPRLDVTLTSKWLDIDRLAGAGSGSAGFAKLQRLAIGLMQSVSGSGAAGARIDLDQVKIGGETAGGLSINAERAGTTTHFKTLKVSLPGVSRVDLSGDLKEAEEGRLSFSGDAFVGGTNFARLRDWAEKSGVPIDIRADGPFSAGGKLEIDQNRFALMDASGDISGRALAGDVVITQDARARAEVTLQASEFDTREVFPKTVAALRAEIKKALGLAIGDDDRGSAQSLQGDVRFRVIAGRLTDGEESLRDVDVTFEREGGEIRLPSAKLTTEDGLSIGLEGRVKTDRGAPVGTLAYDVVGATPAAIRDLVRKTGLEGIVGEARFKGLTGARLAGLIRLGRRMPSAADLSADGIVNGSHFSGTVELDGGFGDWRAKPSRVVLSLDAPSLPVLLTALGQDAHGAGEHGAAPAQAFLMAAGSAAEGSVTRAEVASQGFAMSFSGRATWPETGALAVNGRLDVKANDVADALAVAGFSLPAGAGGVPLRGGLDIVRDDNGVWDLSARGLSLGTASVGGDLKITADAGVQRLSGKLGADRVSVVGLMAALADKPSGQPAAGAAAGAGGTPQAAIAARAPLWSEGLFNFAALGGMEADIELAFGSLDLSRNLATQAGKMRLRVSPSKVTVSDLAADAAGGDLKGTATLEKALNGVALAAKLKLEKARLMSLSASARGVATIDVSAEARAQSPAGLIAVMDGSGSVKLEDAEVRGPQVESLSGVVESVMHGKLQNDPRAVSGALLSALDGATLKLGTRELALKLVDGTVKFDTVAIEAPDGKVEATTAVDLTSLGFDAACQLTSQIRPLPPPPIPLPGWQPSPPKAPPPPAIVLYSGPLDDLASVKAEVNVADLQRELVVRQMERNVEELELSRRVDEERARLERERRKAQEEERAAAIAAERARKEAERLPPVIPQSAGSTSAPTNATAPGPSPVAPGAAPDAPPAPQSAAPQDGPADGAKPAEAAAGAAGTDTILTPKVTVEPIPPTESGVAQPNAPGGDPVIDPATGLPVAPKPEAAKPAPTRPTAAQRAQQSQRTTTEEVLRSLGGYP